MSRPVAFEWTGEAMVPNHPRLADKEFVVGERYALVEHQQRSTPSHNHFFAEMHDLWLNLPEHEAERFPTEDHLRKWCLIKAGYADERSVVASSRAEARRMAVFIKPMDEYAVVSVDEVVITVWTAKSQSLRAMGRQSFQDSKDKVLAIAAELVGVTAQQAVDNVQEAA